jgi:hypothetical protein
MEAVEVIGEARADGMVTLGLAVEQRWKRSASKLIPDVMNLSSHYYTRTLHSRITTHIAVQFRPRQ